MSVEINLLGPPRVTVGEVQRLLGRFDLAAQHFERAIESHPQLVEIEATLRDSLADLYHRSGEEQLSGKARTRAIPLFADLGTDDLEPEPSLFSRW